MASAGASCRTRPSTSRRPPDPDSLRACEAVHTATDLPPTMLPVDPTRRDVRVRDSSPLLVALRWGAVLAFAGGIGLAHRGEACPLTSDECAGIVRDVSQLGGGELDHLLRGERVLEVRNIDGPTRITQVAGALVVSAPPAAAWAVITD